MKINKVINSSIKIAFEPNFDFFSGLIIGVLMGIGLIYIF